MQRLFFRFGIVLGLMLPAMPWLAAEPPAAAVTTDDVQTLPNYTLRLELATDAPKSAIWALWIQVERWPDYDERLAYAHLEEGHRFETGAVGYVKAHDGPRTRFQLKQVQPGESFIETLQLPLYHAIDLRRFFIEGDDGLRFVHEVHFRGPLRWLLYPFLKGPFKHDLPLVMNSMKALAESGRTNDSDHPTEQHQQRQPDTPEQQATAE